MDLSTTGNHSGQPPHHWRHSIGGSIYLSLSPAFSLELLLHLLLTCVPHCPHNCVHNDLESSLAFQSCLALAGHLPVLPGWFSKTPDSLAASISATQRGLPSTVEVEVFGVAASSSLQIPLTHHVLGAARIKLVQIAGVVSATDDISPLLSRLGFQERLLHWICR